MKKRIFNSPKSNFISQFKSKDYGIFWSVRKIALAILFLYINAICIAQSITKNISIKFNNTTVLLDDALINSSPLISCDDTINMVGPQADLDSLLQMTKIYIIPQSEYVKYTFSIPSKFEFVDVNKTAGKFSLSNEGLIKKRLEYFASDPKEDVYIALIIGGTPKLFPIMTKNIVELRKILSQGVKLNYKNQQGNKQERSIPLDTLSLRSSLTITEADAKIDLNSLANSNLLKNSLFTNCQVIIKTGHEKKIFDWPQPDNNYLYDLSEATNLSILSTVKVGKDKEIPNFTIYAFTISNTGQAPIPNMNGPAFIFTTTKNSADVLLTNSIEFPDEVKIKFKSLEKFREGTYKVYAFVDTNGDIIGNGNLIDFNAVSNTIKANSFSSKDIAENGTINIKMEDLDSDANQAIFCKVLQMITKRNPVKVGFALFHNGQIVSIDATTSIKGVDVVFSEWRQIIDYINSIKFKTIDNPTKLFSWDELSTLPFPDNAKLIIDNPNDTKNVKIFFSENNLELIKNGSKVLDLATFELIPPADLSPIDIEIKYGSCVLLAKEIRLPLKPKMPGILLKIDHNFSNKPDKEMTYVEPVAEGMENHKTAHYFAKFYLVEEGNRAMEIEPSKGEFIFKVKEFNTIPGNSSGVVATEIYSTDDYPQLRDDINGRNINGAQIFLKEWMTYRIAILANGDSVEFEFRLREKGMFFKHKKLIIQNILQNPAGGFQVVSSANATISNGYNFSPGAGVGFHLKFIPTKPGNRVIYDLFINPSIVVQGPVVSTQIKTINGQEVPVVYTGLSLGARFTFLACVDFFVQYAEVFPESRFNSTLDPRGFLYSGFGIDFVNLITLLNRPKTIEDYWEW